jgi:CO/xanthine dehydrogenase Mo-binding subunit
MSSDADAPDDVADPPTTREVAAALGVDPDRLRSFVDAHPDPEPPNVLGWATADPALKYLVAAYLAGREQERQERRARQREVRHDKRGWEL